MQENDEYQITQPDPTKRVGETITLRFTEASVHGGDLDGWGIEINGTIYSTMVLTDRVDLLLDAIEDTGQPL